MPRRRLGKELGRNLGELIHLNVNLTPTDFLRKERLAFNFKIGIFFFTYLKNIFLTAERTYIYMKIRNIQSTVKRKMITIEQNAVPKS